MKGFETMNIDNTLLADTIKDKLFPLYMYGDNEDQTVYGAITELTPCFCVTIKNRLDDNTPNIILFSPDFALLNLGWKSSILREAIDNGVYKNKSSLFVQMLRHSAALSSLNLQMTMEGMLEPLAPSYSDILSASIIEYANIKDIYADSQRCAIIDKLFKDIMITINNYKSITLSNANDIIDMVKTTLINNINKLDSSTPGIKILQGLLSLVNSYCANDSKDFSNIEKKIPQNKEKEGISNNGIKLVSAINNNNGKRLEIYYNPDGVKVCDYEIINDDIITITINNQYISLNISQQVILLYNIFVGKKSMFPLISTYYIYEIHKLMLYNMLKESIISFRDFLNLRRSNRELAIVANSIYGVMGSRSTLYNRPDLDLTFETCGID